MRADQLAKLIKCDLQGIAGDDEVSGVAPLSSARHGQVTLVADQGRVSEAIGAAGAILIVDRKLASDDALKGRSLLVADNPKLAFARAIDAFLRPSAPPPEVSDDVSMGEGSTLGDDCSIHPRVTIGRNSRIGSRVTLHPGVVIGDSVIVGSDTTIFANVSIYDETEIGARCRIHSGTVIGADGFSFVPDEEGRQYKLWQVGKVVIEDDVEIGANCCIDRGGFGETRIRRGVKFDNLIQVGHNCDIGEDTVVAALAGFSGGTTVGRNCIIAGQIGTNQHITVGEGAIITARTGVTKSVEPGKLMGGMMPAMDYKKWRKSQTLYARLPEIFDRLKALERKAAAEKEPQ